MERELIRRSSIQLVGLQVRTSNRQEMQPETAKIAKLFGEYLQKNISTKISHLVQPLVIFSVYTDYDSDEHGEYTYFIGQEVSILSSVPEGLHVLNIPASNYQKFTVPAGPMPSVVVEAWQKIWKMTPKELGGTRAYQADFEIYDERASDPANTSLDIYISML